LAVTVTVSGRFGQHLNPSTVLLSVSPLPESIHSILGAWLGGGGGGQLRTRMVRSSSCAVAPSASVARTVNRIRKSPSVRYGPNVYSYLPPPRFVMSSKYGLSYQSSAVALPNWYSITTLSWAGSV
jgi:hypothetical protein